MKELKARLESLDKKNITKIVSFLLLAIFLLVISNFSNQIKKDEKPLQTIVDDEPIEKLENYEAKLEEKLKAILSAVSGVGSVEVMITLSHSEEIIVAEDSDSNLQATKEIDSDGGIREISSEVIEKKTIIIENAGQNEALILKEINPKIEGVLIVAEGGDDPAIKSSLTYVAMALLNLDAHKVSILKMK